MITYAYSAAAGDQSSFWGPIGGSIIITFRPL